MDWGMDWGSNKGMQQWGSGTGGKSFDMSAMMENTQDWLDYKNGKMSDEEAEAYKADLLEKCPWMRRMEAKAQAGELDDTFPFEKTAQEMKAKKMESYGSQKVMFCFLFTPVSISFWFISGAGVVVMIALYF
jgi:hypothetical protein